MPFLLGHLSIFSFSMGKVAYFCLTQRQLPISVFPLVDLEVVACFKEEVTLCFLPQGVGYVCLSNGENLPGLFLPFPLCGFEVVAF